MGEGRPPAPRKESTRDAGAAQRAHAGRISVRDCESIYRARGCRTSDGLNAPPEPQSMPPITVPLSHDPRCHLHCHTRPVRKLENMGFYVGRRLVERHTRNWHLNLDNNHAVMKYLCKEFWQLAFMNAASKLRTNHRGIFVVGDDRFAGCLGHH